MSLNSTKQKSGFLKFLFPSEKETLPVTKEKNTNGDVFTDDSIDKGIMPGCKIEGDITFQQKALFEGEVQGSIMSNSEMILGENCMINGSVRGTRIVLDGEVQGNVIASEILFLNKTAIVHGSINTNKLVIQKGAMIKGNCHIDSIIGK